MIEHKKKSLKLLVNRCEVLHFSCCGIIIVLNKLNFL